MQAITAGSIGLLVLAAAAGPISAMESNRTDQASPDGDFFVVPPYLQNVAADGATVVFETATPARTRVEYGATPALGRVAERMEHGLRVAADTTVHRIRLEGLQPGHVYYYRATADSIDQFGAYATTFLPTVSTALRRFASVDPAAGSVSALFFNDLHENMPLARSLCRAVGAAPADFVVLLGDCIGDPVSATVTASVIAGLVRTFDAGSRPVLFLRGNHEMRGAYAGRLMERFEYPEPRYYFAFTRGPVRFVCLDSGEDKPDDHPAYSGLAAFRPYLEQETQWLRDEVASDAFRSARFRVVLAHIPPLSVPWLRELWQPILKEARVDVVYSGHLHRWSCSGPTADQPYTQFVGGGADTNGATVGCLSADAAQLSVTLYNAAGQVLTNWCVAHNSGDENG